jgi:DNA-binding transcriptional LysR family regulator
MHSRMLDYFEAIIRHGSVRKAGEALNVAPSAINRHLIALEAEIGAPLFHRLPRGMKPTAAGELLARHIRSTIRDFYRVRSEIEQLKTGERGRIRIACIESALSDVLPDIIRRFRAAHPRIDVEIVGLPVGLAVEAVLADRADACIIFNPPRLPLAEIAAVNLPLGLVMAPGHPLAQKASARLSDLVGQDLVMPDDTITIAEQVALALAGSGLKLKPAIISGSIGFMHAYVEGGEAVTVMTPVGIQRKLADKTLVFVPLRDKGLAPQRLICAVPEMAQSLTLANFCRQVSMVFDTIDLAAKESR